MVAVPAAIPVATPGVLMAATLVFEELHCAVDVRSWVVPSEYVPMALKETVAETATEAGFGETETPVSDALEGLVGLVAPPEPPELVLLCTPLHAAISKEARLRIPVMLARRTDVPPREPVADLKNSNEVLSVDIA
jgi:hypothetical protein